MEPTKPRRRWLKFSLGGMLLVITLLCLLLGWQGDRVARQRRAVEMVERLGGTIYFVHQRMTNTPGWHNQQIATPGPRWLHSLIGEECFRTPERAEISDWDGRVGENELQSLCDLQSLKALVLHKSPVTDEDVRIVAGLRHLEELRLYGADITDAGLKELSSLGQLRSLTIGNRWVETAQISDLGLSYLVRLRRLQSLVLGDTCISANGLVQVAELHNLRSLTIGLPPETELRPGCLQELRQLTRARAPRGVKLSQCAGWRAGTEPQVSLGATGGRVAAHLCSIVGFISVWVYVTVILVCCVRLSRDERCQSDGTSNGHR